MALPDYDEKTLLVEAAKLSPSEAVAFFRAKGFKITWDWRETLGDVNNKVFQVARAGSMGVLQDIRNALDTAIADGLTFREFKNQVTPLLQKRGWIAKEGVTPFRLETIYRTNTQSAFNAGRWEQQVRGKARRPFLKLVEILDDATRPTHRRMSGSIKAVESSFWKTWYPPNGFNCRGRVQALTRTQASKQGVGTKASLLPDPGFTGNPGTSIFRPKKGDFDADLFEASKKMKPLPLPEK